MGRPDFDSTASDEQPSDITDDGTSIGTVSFGADSGSDDNLGLLTHSDDTLLGVAYGAQKEDADGAPGV